MTTVLLVRHGATEALGVLLAGSTPGWRLNRLGEAQAQALSRRLSQAPIRKIYTSPLERCLETAQILAAPHQLVPHLRDDLREFDFGVWEGMSFQQLDKEQEWHRFNSCRSVVRVPGGERMIEVQTRMLNAMDELRAVH